MVTVIHKTGKYLQEVNVYSTMSLFNVGKLFAKILATRLNPLLEKLLHRDQTSFIPNRNSSFNNRCLFSIIYTRRAPPIDLFIIALDAKVVFVQIEGHYLFERFNRYNLGLDSCC